MGTAVDRPKEFLPLFPEIEITITDEPSRPGGRTIMGYSWIRCRKETEGLYNDKYYLYCMRLQRQVQVGESHETGMLNFMRYFIETSYLWMHASEPDESLVDIQGRQVCHLDPNQETERQRMVKREKERL